MSEIKVIKISDVVKIGGICRSAIYNKLNPRSPYYDPTFPLPIKLGASSVGWLKHEVEAWLMAQAANRNTGTEG